MQRPYGSGQIYEKWGSYYGRWRLPDGRRLNRVLGRKRVPRLLGRPDALPAEKALRRVQAEQARMAVRDVTVERLTVDDVLDRLRERLALKGARLSYLQNCESMQGIHISPAIGPSYQRRPPRAGRAARQSHAPARTCA
jgi:hypothetical protein